MKFVIGDRVRLRDSRIIMEVVRVSPAGAVISAVTSPEARERYAAGITSEQDGEFNRNAHDFVVWDANIKFGKPAINNFEKEPTPMTDFHIGDLVRLRRGYTAMKVVAVFDGFISAMYTPAGVGRYRTGTQMAKDGFAAHPCSSFTHWDASPMHGVPVNHFETNETTNETTTESEIKMKNTLYTWDDGAAAVFGTKLATNSDGKWVMEIKGDSAKIIAIDPKAVKKVIPYSVSVTFGRASLKQYAYWANKGDVVVGQMVILTDGSIVTVRKLDTQSEAATKWLTGMALQGTILTEHPE